jgi:dTDP-4-amino-4,6-dideoxygalactose transaminase
MINKLEWPVWPKYNSEHEEAVLRVIRSNQLFAAQEVAAFEQEFAKYLGSKHAVGVGNATQALHLALASLGIGTGDEVIVTPYSWISSASCVIMQNAIPVFVDIEAKTFGICPEELLRAITSRTKAVILVHMFGLASKINEIKEICEAHRIPLIEDASHAHGAKFRNKNLGSFGEIGVFSLHQRKAISTGDGGILCTSNTDVYERLKRLRSFGAPQLSYNYRMSEFSAALGIIGLKHLDAQNLVRRRNHRVLVDHLQHETVSVIEPNDEVEAVYYSNLIDINLPIAVQNNILMRCNDLGVPLKRTWQPLHWHSHFRRENMPNQIAPWDGYYQKFTQPEHVKLPTAERYQTSRLFELDCHPLVSEEKVLNAAKIICTIVSDESRIL